MGFASTPVQLISSHFCTYTMNQNNKTSDGDVGIEGGLLESRDDAPTRTESAFVPENCCPTDEEDTQNQGVRLDGTRHPHSCSIMDTEDTMEWILRLVE